MVPFAKRFSLLLAEFHQITLSLREKSLAYPLEA
jgi:hypothetical protein